MTDGEMDITNYRKHARYRVRREGVVIVTPNNIVSFDVSDISMKGLAFTYVGWEDWGRGELQLTYFHNKAVLLKDIPVKVISDVKSDDQTGLDDDSPPLRRCGVEFLSLTEQQGKDLAEYIAGLEEA